MSTEHLNAVIDNLIQGDHDAVKAAFSTYVKDKAREVLNRTPPQMNESFKYKVLKEMFDDHDSPVKFQGDDVIVDGKKVGVIQTDYTDFDSGTNFIEEGGRFSKEFTSLEELFDFLISRYTKQGNV